MVRQRSAKPLFGGSIPPAASNIQAILEISQEPKLIFCCNELLKELNIRPLFQEKKMASIYKHGPYQWQALIRRKGLETQSRVLNTKAEA